MKVICYEDSTSDYHIIANNNSISSSNMTTIIKNNIISN